MIGSFCPMSAASDFPDPHFASVVGLYHFEATNNGAAGEWIDSSSRASHMMKPVLGQIPQAQGNGRFGKGAVLGNSTATRARAGVETIPLLFTYEFFTYLYDDQPGNWNKYFLMLRNRANTWEPSIELIQTGHCMWWCNNTSFISNDPLPRNRWVHIAVARSSGGWIRMFIDGVEQTANLNATTVWTDASFWVGGAHGIFSNGPNGRPNGLMDELRATYGVCRYGRSFGIPTSEYPNKGA